MTPAPLKPLVTAAHLEALDIRVGTIQQVDDVTTSRKLARFVVDFGDRSRVVIAGMKKERPDLSVLVGRQALFVVNLEPRTMAGELSEAMFFDLGYADGITPVLAVPEHPVPNGTRAG
jgi:methionine--tRNA ligase beta chain